MPYWNFLLIKCIINPMSNNAIFNATVCLVGFVILLVHIANILMKKNRRKDENALLNFIVFTALHFDIYFTFTMIKVNYTSDSLIMGFYTTFYIANNLEVFLLFLYFKNYVGLPEKGGKALQIGNVSVLLVFTVLDIVNLFTPLFFYAENGVYLRAKGMILAQGYQFIAFAMVFLLAVFNRRLLLREKIAFGIY